MIALDELLSTAKRLELLHNNCDDPVEKWASAEMYRTLMQMHEQIRACVNNPEFVKRLTNTEEENEER